MYEAITRERLQKYTEILKYFKRLVEQKQRLLVTIGSIKSIDYSKDRVTNGHSKPHSEQERFVLRLEKINKEIKEYKTWILDEQEIIKNQISRIREPNYIKVLVLKYLYNWEWKKIRYELFSDEPDFAEEEQDKYRDKAFDWHKSAIQKLEKISATPYVPIKQQHLI